MATVEIAYDDLFNCIEETLDAYRHRDLSAENALAEILYAIKKIVTERVDLGAAPRPPSS